MGRAPSLACGSDGPSWASCPVDPALALLDAAVETSTGNHPLPSEQWRVVMRKSGMEWRERTQVLGISSSNMTGFRMPLAP
jgi:hypothetical protein